MTIQILQATDNNPPKISFLSIFKPSKAKKNVSPRPSHLFHRKLKRDNVHDFQ